MIFIADNMLFISEDSRDADAKHAFESLLFITLTVPDGATWYNFSEQVKLRAKRDYSYEYNEEVRYLFGVWSFSMKILWITNHANNETKHMNIH